MWPRTLRAGTCCLARYITILYSKLLWLGIMFQGDRQLPSAGIKPASVPHISEAEQHVNLLRFFIFCMGVAGEGVSEAVEPTRNHMSCTNLRIWSQCCGHAPRCL